ncbi:MAG: hypothetical protein ACKV2V_26125 [Blastocatellia bacterium]
MNEKLRAHAITGAGDQGLMLIGSRATLEKLAAELTEALREAPEKESVNWPRLLCAAPAPNPDGSDWPWSVSFHLETVTGDKPALPLYSRAPGKGTLVLWALALTGVVAIVNWIIHLL